MHFPMCHYQVNTPWLQNLKVLSFMFEKNLPIQKLLQSTIFLEDHTYAVDRRGKAEQG